ncbi:MAG: tRNA 2-thiocytidine biosynthesis TtcA family protein [Lachnospiraceae bacterium]
MELQRLYSLVRKALENYDMIQEHDHIAIGISGGKDSLTLLYALAGLRNFYPKPFTLSAISVDLGFQDMNFDAVEKLCNQLEVPYYRVSTQISQIVFEARKETNPCSLCSKMRKGALNEKALELGCDKIAYAHHRDDVVETFFMSLLFEGRLHTFSPVTYLNKTKLTLIRPLIYVHEPDVIGFLHKYDLPVIKNTCPADGNTRRKYVKELLSSINRETPGVKNRIFTALVQGQIS